MLKFIFIAALAMATDVALTQSESQDMLRILQRTKALNEDFSCGAGTCYNNGQLDVICKYPVSKKETQKVNCTVSALNKDLKPTELDKDTSKKMKSWIDQISAAVPTDDSCGSGSCYVQRKIDVTCRYPTSEGKDKLTCAIEPLAKESPNEAKKASAKKATR